MSTNIRPTKMNTTDNPRDFVEKLDALIKLRSKIQTGAVEEQAELLKRDLTDYLLLNDKRPGIFVKGDNQ